MIMEYFFIDSLVSNEWSLFQHFFLLLLFFFRKKKVNLNTSLNGKENITLRENSKFYNSTKQSYHWPQVKLAKMSINLSKLAKMSINLSKLAKMSINLSKLAKTPINLSKFTETSINISQFAKKHTNKPMFKLQKCQESSGNM